jgi:hypothetical protein
MDGQQQQIALRHDTAVPRQTAAQRGAVAAVLNQGDGIMEQLARETAQEYMARMGHGQLCKPDQKSENMLDRFRRARSQASAQETSQAPQRDQASAQETSQAPQRDQASAQAPPRASQRTSAQAPPRASQRASAQAPQRASAQAPPNGTPSDDDFIAKMIAGKMRTHGNLVTDGAAIRVLAGRDQTFFDPATQSLSVMLRTSREVLQQNAEFAATPRSELEWGFRARQFFLARLVKQAGGGDSDTELAVGITPSRDMRYIRAVCVMVACLFSGKHMHEDDWFIKSVGEYIGKTSPFGLVANACMSVCFGRRLGVNVGQRDSFLKFFRMLVPVVGILADTETGPVFIEAAQKLPPSELTKDGPVESEVGKTLARLREETGHVHYETRLTQNLLRALFPLIAQCPGIGKIKSNQPDQVAMRLHVRLTAATLRDEGRVEEAMMTDGTHPKLLNMQNNPMEASEEEDNGDDLLGFVVSEEESEEEHTELVRYPGESDADFRKRAADPKGYVADARKLLWKRARKNHDATASVEATPMPPPVDAVPVSAAGASNLAANVSSVVARQSMIRRDDKRRIIPSVSSAPGSQ